MLACQMAKILYDGDEEDNGAVPGTYQELNIYFKDWYVNE